MRQVENSLNLLETGSQPQEAQRCSKKPLFILMAFMLLLISVGGILMCHFSHSKAPESCWAQANLDYKSQTYGKVGWVWTTKFHSCMEETEHQTLRIRENGIYLFYVHITRKSLDNQEESSHFAVQLKKGDVVLNQSESNGTVLYLMGIHDLNKGDEITLTLNDGDMKSIEKEPFETYWGVLRMMTFTS